MANSILGKRAIPSRLRTGFRNNPMQLMQQFQQFRNTFQGNPQAMVQQMLQTGQINEAQLQQAMQMAKQFQHMIK